MNSLFRRLMAVLILPGLLMDPALAHVASTTSAVHASQGLFTSQALNPVFAKALHAYNPVGWILRRLIGRTREVRANNTIPLDHNAQMPITGRVPSTEEVRQIKENLETIRIQCGIGGSLNIALADNMDFVSMLHYKSNGTSQPTLVLHQSILQNKLAMRLALLHELWHLRLIDRRGGQWVSGRTLLAEEAVVLYMEMMYLLEKSKKSMLEVQEYLDFLRHYPSIRHKRYEELVANVLQLQGDGQPREALLQLLGEYAAPLIKRGRMDNRVLAQAMNTLFDLEIHSEGEKPVFFPSHYRRTAMSLFFFMAALLGTGALAPAEALTLVPSADTGWTLWNLLRPWLPEFSAGWVASLGVLSALPLMVFLPKGSGTSDPIESLDESTVLLIAKLPAITDPAERLDYLNKNLKDSQVRLFLGALYWTAEPEKYAGIFADAFLLGTPVAERVRDRFLTALSAPETGAPGTALLGSLLSHLPTDRITALGRWLIAHGKNGPLLDLALTSTVDAGVRRHRAGPDSADGEKHADLVLLYGNSLALLKNSPWDDLSSEMAYRALFMLESAQLEFLTDRSDPAKAENLEDNLIAAKLHAPGVLNHLQFDPQTVNLDALAIARRWELLIAVYDTYADFLELYNDGEARKNRRLAANARNKLRAHRLETAERLGLAKKGSYARLMSFFLAAIGILGAGAFSLAAADPVWTLAVRGFEYPLWLAEIMPWLSGGLTWGPVDLAGLFSMAAVPVGHFPVLSGNLPDVQWSENDRNAKRWEKDFSVYHPGYGVGFILEAPPLRKSGRKSSVRGTVMVQFPKRQGDRFPIHMLKPVLSLDALLLVSGARGSARELLHDDSSLEPYLRQGPDIPQNYFTWEDADYVKEYYVARYTEQEAFTQSTLAAELNVNPSWITNQVARGVLVPDQTVFLTRRNVRHFFLKRRLAELKADVEASRYYTESISDDDLGTLREEVALLQNDGYSLAVIARHSHRTRRGLLNIMSGKLGTTRSTFDDVLKAVRTIRREGDVKNARVRVGDGRRLSARIKRFNDLKFSYKMIHAVSGVHPTTIQTTRRTKGARRHIANDIHAGLDALEPLAMPIRPRPKWDRGGLNALQRRLKEYGERLHLRPYQSIPVVLVRELRHVFIQVIRRHDRKTLVQKGNLTRQIVADAASATATMKWSTAPKLLNAMRKLLILALVIGLFGFGSDVSAAESAALTGAKPQIPFLNGLLSILAPSVTAFLFYRHVRSSSHKTLVSA